MRTIAQICLFIFILCYLNMIIVASSKEIIPSVHLQDSKMEERGTYKRDSADVRYNITHSSKFARGFDGGSTGTAGHGNTDASGSSNGQEGTNVLPAYGAGAANTLRKKSHHGAGSSNHNLINLPLIFIILAVQSYMRWQY